jgi:hypothetical protein
MMLMEFFKTFGIVPPTTTKTTQMPVDEQKSTAGEQQTVVTQK